MLACYRPHKSYLSYLAPGFQSVIRCLEKKELCCVVLSSDVTPALIQKVLLAYAQSSSVPIVIIPDLRSITKSTLGFASMVLGFKNVVAESTENLFHPIYRLISQSPTIIEPSFIVKQKEGMVNVKTPKDSNNGCCMSISQQPTKLYVFREKGGGRGFIPIKKESKTHRENTEDFISLKETQETTSTSPSFSKQISISETQCDVDDDESDDKSDEEIFFVDNKLDESFLKTEKCNLEISEFKDKTQFVRYQTKCMSSKKPSYIVGSTQIIKPERGLTSGVNRFENKQQFETSNAKTTSVVSMLVPKNIDTVRTTSQKSAPLLKSKFKKQLKKNINLVNEINFRPLSIKSTTSNPKHIRTKNKNKM